MDIENIVYNTTRNVYNLSDKLSIATIFLFCWQLDSKTFSELLYTKNHNKFIKDLNKRYSDFQIDLSINLKDKAIEDAFKKTLQKVKEKYDDSGYFKALYEGDSFALVINDIVDIYYSKGKMNEMIDEFKSNSSMIKGCNN